MKDGELDVEALARPEVRARLSLWHLLWLYLDPFCLFKSMTDEASQAEAWRYNRQHRRILIAYLRRWAAIGALCLAGMAPLAASAAADPLLVVPILGLELGFSAAVCMLTTALALYIVLGVER
jgi:hypothetical protein